MAVFTKKEMTEFFEEQIDRIEQSKSKAETD